jgi:hypothetical protein
MPLTWRAQIRQQRPRGEIGAAAEKVMKLPKVLSLELQNLSSSLDEAGELPAPSRQALHQLIERLSSEEHVDAGYLRRARLAILCAWKSSDRLHAYPAVLARAESVASNGLLALKGQYELKDLEAENGRLHTEASDLLEEGEHAFTAVYGAMAFFAAINTVLYDINFDILGQKEKSLPADSWDASFFASLAISGSASWEEQGGESERRSFWNWYLTTAVPLAWNVLLPLETARSNL